VGRATSQLLKDLPEKGLPPLPASLDRYQLVRPLGRGGMAEVFLARLGGIGGFEREVAVKVLLPELSCEHEFVEMLLDEARLAGAITHPNVVQVIDVGQAHDVFYLVMELIDGSDLRALLKRRRTLPLGAALFIACEVLRGLAAVHDAVDENGICRRIIHRDVSPANVLIGRSGIVKLGDFGIAHAASRLTRTRNGALKGKLRYMAPEQLSAGKVDHRADLYALGVMLVEMLLGDCQPRKLTPYGPVFAWSPRLAAGLPPDVAQILERTLAEDPERRFAGAEELRQKLAVALHQRHPGYGAEELARDLIAPADATDATERQNLESPRSVKLKLPLWTRGTLGWAAGAAGAAALAISALVMGGASSAAAPPPVSIVAAAARPLPARHATTGTLAVAGPPGATVSLGATVYPAGSLELPPGEYQVTLKRRPRGRAQVRRVIIEAGVITALKI
jgi:serine/threonine-protein kinase